MKSSLQHVIAVALAAQLSFTPPANLNRLIDSALSVAASVLLVAAVTAIPIPVTGSVATALFDLP